jgi:hypothetical protein
METARPQAIGPAHRTVAAGPATPGMVREQAFTSDDRWVGVVRTEPGVRSGWHHHGDTETYFYVLSGAMELEFGPGGRERLGVVAGDYAHHVTFSRAAHRGPWAEFEELLNRRADRRVDPTVPRAAADLFSAGEPTARRGLAQEATPRRDPARPAPEADALSTELQAREPRSYADRGRLPARADSYVVGIRHGQGGDRVHRIRRRAGDFHPPIGRSTDGS